MKNGGQENESEHLNRIGSLYRLLLTQQAIKTSDKIIYEIQKEMIVEFLTDKVSAKAAEIADLLNVSPQRARAVLSKMIAEDLIVADGANRNRTYRLKS